MAKAKVSSKAAEKKKERLEAAEGASIITK